MTDKPKPPEEGGAPGATEPAKQAQPLPLPLPPVARGPMDPLPPAKPQPPAAGPQPRAAMPQPPTAGPQPRAEVPQPRAEVPQPRAAMPPPPTAAPPPPTAAPPSAVPPTAVPPTAGPQPRTAVPPSAVPAEEISRSQYLDNELRDAVGVTPSAEPRKRRRPRDEDDEDDDAGDRPRGRRSVFVAIASLVVGLAIAALVVLGRINSSQLAIACEPERVVAERGRSFPPWGTRTLEDAQWKPIKIPPEAECRARDTDDEAELSGWYLAMLVDRASGLLSHDVTRHEEAAAMLEQALLHARAPERRDQRKDIERLLGDVGYWRATARVRDAAGALGEAAKQFEAASNQQPRHVTDAAAWAAYVRRIAEQIKAGPGGATPGPATPESPRERPLAPPGVALPVEPDRGSAGDRAGSAEAPPPAPSLPSGGVLL